MVQELGDSGVRVVISLAKIPAPFKPVGLVSLMCQVSGFHLGVSELFGEILLPCVPSAVRLLLIYSPSVSGYLKFKP